VGAGDTEGVEHYTRQVLQGASRGQLVEWMQSSEEYRGLQVVESEAKLCIRRLRWHPAGWLKIDKLGFGAFSAGQCHLPRCQGRV
jgi:hypothetical protein